MEERKTMGSALVDVFDAGVALVKSEINGVARKAGEVAKAKGIGMVLLLAAVGPLLMGLIFLILAVFYLLSLWMPAWGAALIIALFSFALMAGLMLLGVQKLGAQVDTELPLRPVPVEPRTPETSFSAAPGGVAVAVPAATAAQATGDVGTGGVYVKDLRYATEDRLGTVMGDPNANGTDARVTNVERANRTVYESQPSGEAQYYGSGLNRKLDGHQDDPNLQNPVVLKDAPGISVSTKPTYPQDMREEGY